MHPMRMLVVAIGLFCGLGLHDVARAADARPVAPSSAASPAAAAPARPAAPAAPTSAARATRGATRTAPPPASSPSAAPSAAECALLFQRYFEGQACFAPCRLAGGGIRAECFERCVDVPDPSPRCGLPTLPPPTPAAVSP